MLTGKFQLFAKERGSKPFIVAYVILLIII